MTVRVTYLDCNNKGCTITLLNMEWQTIRGQRVLRGQQKINGRLVNRSIAANEILPNGIRVSQKKGDK